MKYNKVRNAKGAIDDSKYVIKNPENYKDLLVRVSGFSAYFTHLPKEVQQEVIDRNEQSFN